MRALFSAAVFLTLLIAGTPAEVNRKVRSSPFCDTVSFKLQNDNNEYFRNQDLFQCNDLSSNQAQTAIKLQPSSSGCSFKLIAYSGRDCRDDRKINVFSLNSRSSSVTLRGHQRKSVCSYKLGNSPQRGRSVLVKFGGGNVDVVTHELYERGCRSLCGSSYERLFPQWAGVYNQAGNIAHDNYIELFSEPYCADGSQIRFGKNGRTDIQYERLEEIGQSQAIGSFMFVNDADLL